MNLINNSTLKISAIIARISLKLTPSYFSGPMLVIVVKNKKLKQKKNVKNKIKYAGISAATFWHSSKQVSSILRAQSGQAYMWNPESFQFLLCNLESWPLESRIQLKELGIKVRIGIQNPSSTDEESGFQYLES